ncbi:MAG TPA: hypothetical protein VF648_06900 [Pyrinomonadaceae bacterium]
MSEAESTANSSDFSAKFKDTGSAEIETTTIYFTLKSAGLTAFARGG